jgi:hypothetical protein
VAEFTDGESLRVFAAKELLLDVSGMSDDELSLTKPAAASSTLPLSVGKLVVLLLG